MREMNHVQPRSRFFTGSAGLIAALTAMFVTGIFAGEAMPPIRLVDAHTAGVIPKGYFAIESRLYDGSVPGQNTTGFLVTISVGVTDRFSLGLGYGAEGIIGRSDHPRFNPFPGCLVKYRLLEENYFLPAVAIGFDYQGFGGIADNHYYGYTGYIYKSQGFFAACSKSYLLFKTIAFGFHGDINWSLEEIGKVKWPDAWAGFDLGLSQSFSFVIEYDFGLNTRDPYRGENAYALPQDGYLNAGFRWNLTPNFAVELDARDMLENRRYLTDPDDVHSERRLGWSREIKIVYMAPIR
jgi:hypothetical protein